MSNVDKRFYTHHYGYMGKKVFIGVALILVLAATAFVSYHYYLLKNNRGVQVHIGNFNLFRLGSSRAFFPAELEQSFIKVANGKVDVREARYPHNVLIKSETEGDIIGSDVSTHAELTYSWVDGTHYICIPPDKAQPQEYNKNIDPATDLSSYKFYFSGNNVPGIATPDFGLLMFRKDASISGTPAQIYLKNETLNQWGGYDLVGVVVFTKNKTCATPDDVKSYFQNL